MEAFDEWQKQDISRHEYNLVIVGPRGWGDTPHHPNAHVIILDQVSDALLGQLYRHALALVMPSLYEGFGYPLIEAMSCECPVIASNTSSLAELIEDGAGLGVDPTQTKSIIDAMNKVYMDTALRASLISNGLKKAEQFSWSAYLRQLNSAIDSL
jgi:glycosyltransferase involved in cell wall biosynthesis